MLFFEFSSKLLFGRNLITLEWNFPKMKVEWYTDIRTITHVYQVHTHANTECV